MESCAESRDTQNQPQAIGSDMKKVKCVVVGDDTVGKTSLLLTHTMKKFPNEYLPTVFDNFWTVVTLNGQSVNLGLWDTGGQRDFDHLRPISYPDADVFVICFSLISQESLQNVRSKWYPEIQHYRPNTPVVVVGTKLDRRENRSSLVNPVTPNLHVSTEMGLTIAQEIAAVHYIECSASTQKNLSKLFEVVVKAGLGKLAPPSLPAFKKKKQAKSSCRLL